jgi:hypothetical protein
MLCLENTVEVLKALAERKPPVLFMNVVHASTLVDGDRRMEFTSLAETIPPAARRQLLFEVVDIGDHAHTAEAIQIVRNLSPYSRAVTGSIGLQDRNIAFWKRCGLMAVGVDLSRDRRTEEEIIGDLAYFVSQTKRNKLLSYLRELDRFSMTISGAGAGFDFLEGSTIGSSDDPANLALTKFNIENLYSDDTEAVWAAS